MEIYADDATLTLASPSVCVRYIHTCVHNYYIMVYVCIVFLAILQVNKLLEKRSTTLIHQFEKRDIPERVIHSLAKPL